MITVQTIVKAPLEKVWAAWNKPEHIMKWAFASDDWEAPFAENDIRIGGRFKTTMAAKDKSASFDFTGTYTDVKENELIEYDMDVEKEGDTPRHVKIELAQTPDGVQITESFDPENVYPQEQQQAGWQSILDHFKNYTESL